MLEAINRILVTQLNHLPEVLELQDHLLQEALLNLLQEALELQEVPLSLLPEVLET